jgi:hypothetical protein
VPHTLWAGPTTLSSHLPPCLSSSFLRQPPFFLLADAPASAAGRTVCRRPRGWRRKHHLPTPLSFNHHLCRSSTAPGLPLSPPSIPTPARSLDATPNPNPRSTPTSSTSNPKTCTPQTLSTRACSAASTAASHDVGGFVAPPQRSLARPLPIHLLHRRPVSPTIIPDTAKWVDPYPSGGVRRDVCSTLGGV